MGEGHKRKGDHAEAGRKGGKLGKKGGKQEGQAKKKGEEKGEKPQEEGDKPEKEKVEAPAVNIKQRKVEAEAKYLADAITAVDAAVDHATSGSSAGNSESKGETKEDKSKSKGEEKGKNRKKKGANRERRRWKAQTESLKHLKQKAEENTSRTAIRRGTVAGGTPTQ